jgi:hypothetical protein
MDNLTDEQAIKVGLELARDVLLAQRLGRMPQMVSVLDEAPRAALAYALMYVAAVTDAYVLHAAGGNKRHALDMIRTPGGSIAGDIAGSIASLRREAG